VRGWMGWVGWLEVRVGGWLIVGGLKSKRTLPRLMEISAGRVLFKCSEALICSMRR
jgi:hypothetical protein